MNVEETSEGDEKEEHYDEFNARIEILVDLEEVDLRPFTLSDCYATDRPGMQLEILPKIIFDTLDEDVDDDAADLPIFRQTIDRGTQASVKYRSSKAQTLRRRLVNSWCQCEPRVFSDEEKEEHLVEDSFSAFLTSAEQRILKALTQNRIADIFFWDLNFLCNDHMVSSEEKETTLKVSGSFAASQSSEGKNKMISSIHWNSTHKDIFVASTITICSSEERIKNLLQSQNDSVPLYMWWEKNQFSPQLILECFDDVYIIKFNSSLPDVIVGGTLTGQLVLWDIKNKLLPTVNENIKDSNSVSSVPCCATSSMDHLHVHGITHLQWIPPHFEVASKGFTHKNSSNTSFQIATCSLDGLLHFWDLRSGYPHKTNITIPKKYTHLDGIWEPFHTMQVISSKENIKSLTCFTFRENTSKEDNDLLEKESSVLYENEDRYADFYGGCDDGTVLCGSFKLVKDDEGKYAARSPDLYLTPHSSSVSVIVSSPFLRDVFMSAGGKTVAIWKHEIKVRPLLLRERNTCITSGEWSPTRAAIFVIGLKDGSIEVWDLLQNTPIIIHYVSTSPLKCLAIQILTETEHVIAIGDSSGVVYTMTLPLNLCFSPQNELARMKDFVEKETSRITEQNIPHDDRRKENKSTPRQQNEKKFEKEMYSSYEAFLDLQKQQINLLGIAPGKTVDEELSHNV